ncbi:hypothetical protein BDZ91DRAFT_763161 [Kalaharituber pfeilii]|nr:hypothetical protein BDZ91DRAFT_763161 [Kalaharituber pfeilii]
MEAERRKIKTESKTPRLLTLALSWGAVEVSPPSSLTPGSNDKWRRLITKPLVGTIRGLEFVNSLFLVMNILYCHVLTEANEKNKCVVPLQKEIFLSQRLGTGNENTNCFHPLKPSTKCWDGTLDDSLNLAARSKDSQTKKDSLLPQRPFGNNVLKYLCEVEGKRQPNVSFTTFQSENSFQSIGDLELSGGTVHQEQGSSGKGKKVIAEGVTMLINGLWLRKKMWSRTYLCAAILAAEGMN